MPRPIRAALFLAACGILVSCATSGKELVVVVPSADGHVGEVEVQVGDEVTTLDEANEAVTIGARKAKPTTLTDAEIEAEFGDTLDALPVPPRRFTLNFDEGTEQLDDRSEAQLAQILEDIHSRDTFEIDVIGHTDRLDDAQYNARLSGRRASTVRDWLVSNGVPSESISIVGRGELDPLVPTEDGVAEPQNRRVEVTIR